ncbi:MAG: hypothetical protein WD294_05625 [Phycisphaeraceae bacterium]
MNRALFAVVIALIGMTCATGCGETPQDEMWNDVVRIASMQERYAVMQSRNGGQGMIAGAIDQTLQRYPDSSEPLRRVLTAIRDGERQLAEGRVRGQEAEAMRARNAEYWSHLVERELPPEFR